MGQAAGPVLFGALIEHNSDLQEEPRCAGFSSVFTRGRQNPGSYQIMQGEIPVTPVTEAFHRIFTGTWKNHGNNAWTWIHACVCKVVHQKQGAGKGERPMLKNQMKLDEKLLENIWGGRPGSVYEFTSRKIDGMFIDGKNQPGGNEDILKPTHS